MKDIVSLAVVWHVGGLLLDLKVELLGHHQPPFQSGSVYLATEPTKRYSMTPGRAMEFDEGLGQARLLTILFPPAL